MKKEKFNSWINLTDKEVHRKYFYPNGETIEVDNLEAIQIKPDGSHLIKLKNGLKVHIKTGWVSFYFLAPSNDFSFNVVNQDLDSLSTWMCLQGKEKTRTYTFNKFEYTIENPVKAFIKKSGSHKIVDSKGICHYIDKSFNYLSINNKKNDN